FVQFADSTAGQGPYVIADRNSSSPAANDTLGLYILRGRNSSAANIDYAFTRAAIVDATAASEDVYWDFITYVAGAAAARLRVGAGVYHPSATGGDKTAGTINFQAVYDDNVLLT